VTSIPATKPDSRTVVTAFDIILFPFRISDREK
jgi:hypothetical protein